MNDYIDIFTNKNNNVLYTGVTNNLIRIYEHKNKLIDGFTKKYNVTKLEYFEEYTSIIEAIKREKQFKGRYRSKKYYSSINTTINGKIFITFYKLLYNYLFLEELRRFARNDIPWNCHCEEWTKWMPKQSKKENIRNLFR